MKLLTNASGQILTSGGAAIEAPDNEQWVRPLNWPNLDKVDLTQEGLYFTYDCRERIAGTEVGLNTGKFSIAFYGTGSLIWEQGHIGANGFVADKPAETVTSGAIKYGNLPTDAGDFVVYRVTPSSGNHINTYSIINLINENYSQIQDSRWTQPCVEIVGNLDYLNQNSSYYWGTYLLEHHHIVMGSTSRCTTLAGMFYMCSSLRSVDMSSWDTSNWEVTSIGGMFYMCSSLRSVDMSSWDTSNWAVTTLKSMFYYCYCIRFVDMSSWDTSNWAVTTLNSMFYYCQSLRSLDLSGWDTSGWAVTNVANIFSYNRSITHLRMSEWFPQSTDISATKLITHDSLISVLNALPTTQTALTLTLGTYNLGKLSAAEKQIATDKGWTLV